MSFQVGSSAVRFAVQDSGIGIAEESLPHIFERFYRVKQSTYTEGTGIGLALVKELVQAHGGSIKVQSALGKGSTFSIDIPLGSKHLNAAQIRDRSVLKKYAFAPFYIKSYDQPKVDRSVAVSSTCRAHPFSYRFCGIRAQGCCAGSCKECLCHPSCAAPRITDNNTDRR